MVDNFSSDIQPTKQLKKKQLISELIYLFGFNQYVVGELNINQLREIRSDQIRKINKLKGIPIIKKFAVHEGKPVPLNAIIRIIRAVEMIRREFPVVFNKKIFKEYLINQFPNHPIDDRHIEKKFYDLAIKSNIIVPYENKFVVSDFAKSEILYNVNNYMLKKTMVDMCNSSTWNNPVFEEITSDTLDNKSIERFIINELKGGSIDTHVWYNFFCVFITEFNVSIESLSSVLGVSLKKNLIGIDEIRRDVVSWIGNDMYTRVYAANNTSWALGPLPTLSLSLIDEGMLVLLDVAEANSVDDILSCTIRTYRTTLDSIVDILFNGVSLTSRCDMRLLWDNGKYIGRAASMGFILVLLKYKFELVNFVDNGLFYL